MRGSVIKQNDELYLVISNNQYNRHFDTRLVLPISSNKLFEQNKFKNSSFFVSINVNNNCETVLLQVIKTIAISQNDAEVDKVSNSIINKILAIEKQLL